MYILQNDASAKVKYSWTDGWPVTYTQWDAYQPSGEVLQDLKGCTKINKYVAAFVNQQLPSIDFYKMIQKHFKFSDKFI